MTDGVVDGGSEDGIGARKLTLGVAVLQERDAHVGAMEVLFWHVGNCDEFFLEEWYLVPESVSFV